MARQIGVSENPLNKKMRDEYTTEIYKAAVIYYAFSNSDKDKIEKDDVYIISKEFIDFFKEKIKYSENQDLFKQKTDENYDKFYKKLNNYSLSALEEIIFKQIMFYGDLNDLEDNIAIGFEFVSKDFLDSLEFDLQGENEYDNESINFEEYKVKYIKDSNNIIIVFKDDSKLIVCTDKNGTKYHAIPAPVNSVSSSKNKVLKKMNTICVSRRADKTVVVRRAGDPLK